MITLYHILFITTGRNALCPSKSHFTRLHKLCPNIKRGKNMGDMNIVQLFILCKNSFLADILKKTIPVTGRSNKHENMLICNNSVRIFFLQFNLVGYCQSPYKKMVPVAILQWSVQYSVKEHIFNWAAIFSTTMALKKNQASSCSASNTFSQKVTFKLKGAL